VSVVSVQRELFSIFGEFFAKATGKTPKEFASLREFSETIRKNARKIGPRTVRAFEWGIPKLAAFYEQQRTTLFQAARIQGGIKVVLGGGGPFRRTQLNAVRRLLLYADSVLIPDPILTWIETDRQEERFRHVLLLERLFFLLRLRRLVDADFGYPPLIVFPSWERTLALTDIYTRGRIDLLISHVLSVYLGKQFSNVIEIAEYASSHGDKFLAAVESSNLFVAPGGTVGEPIQAAISRYRSEVQQWRAGVHLEDLKRLSDAQLVYNAILERLEPQFHVIENANELKAQPLFAITAQAHYFNLCASASNNILVENEIITPPTRATMKALSQLRFEWLGNAPIAALVEMRQKNENEQFRDKLSKSIASLNSASLEDLDRVASEVGLAIGALLNDHKQEARRIEEEYKNKFAGIAGGAWLTAAVSAIPYLAPLFAAVQPLLLTKQYTETKLSQKREKRELANSLLGILAGVENDSGPEDE